MHPKSVIFDLTRPVLRCHQYWQYHTKFTGMVLSQAQSG